MPNEPNPTLWESLAWFCTVECKGTYLTLNYISADFSISKEPFALCQNTPFGLINKWEGFITRQLYMILRGHHPKCLQVHLNPLFITNKNILSTSLNRWSRYKVILQLCHQEKASFLLTHHSSLHSILLCPRGSINAPGSQLAPCSSADQQQQQQQNNVTFMSTPV